MKADMHLTNELVKLCRHGLAYRLTTDPENEWHLAGIPYTPEAARKLKEQFGADLAMIAQERVAELRFSVFHVLET